MIEPTTRRAFLRKSVAASGCLMVPGMSLASEAERSAIAGDDQHGAARMAPIIVVTQSVSRDVNPRASTWGYITEILQRAGLFFEQIPASGLSSLLGRATPIVLLAGDLPLTSADREVLEAVVRRGGSLIGIGGTSGLDKVFGIRGKRPLMEGWMKPIAQGHRVTSGLRSSLGF